MNNLSLRTPIIYCLIITITLLITFWSWLLPSFINTYGILISFIFIVGIGIPHGATDHLVFNYLFRDKLCMIYKVKFYLFYIFLALIYVISWYLFPTFSLAAFIIISVYHLGQSNLFYLSLPKNKIIKTLIYSSWGLFVIFAPIISNSKEVIAILKTFLDESWIINIENQEYLLALIVFSNFLILSILFVFKYLTKQELLREILNLTVLSLLFYTAPLMVSFGVYFGLWHSLGSSLDQIQFIRKYDLKFDFANFYIKSIPLTLISITAFILSYLFLVHFNYSQQDINITISWFFIGLAAITLPHTIIRDRLYIN